MTVEEFHELLQKWESKYPNDEEIRSVLNMIVESDKVCDDLFHVAWLINQTFHYKGYHNVNLVWENIDGKHQFCLQFNASEVNWFVKDMVDGGFECMIHEAHKKRYRWVTINGYNPICLMFEYRYLVNKINI